MKTFYEWLELNEAGFFGNLFGKKALPVQQHQVKKTDDEFDNEGNSLRGGPPKPGSIAAFNAVMDGLRPASGWASMSSGSTPSPSPSTNSNVSKSGSAPSNSNVSKVSNAKLSLFEQLYQISDANIKKYYLDEIKTRNNGSLKDEDNMYELRRLYQSLSRSKCDRVHGYKPDYSLSGSDLDKSISIIEQMFKSELNARAFPEGVEPGDIFNRTEKSISSRSVANGDPYDTMWDPKMHNDVVLVAKGFLYPDIDEIVVSAYLVRRGA